jgi:peptidoglycan/xylan/chitin deacetylase (PgdA/CDA1 family)
MIYVLKFLTRLFPKRIWTYPTQTSTVYLTFDDGPIPEVSPWVLEQLETFKAKATFFCIGDNVKKHPDVFQKVLDAGHVIGNHTFHHYNGWKTTTTSYIKDVAACSAAFKVQHPAFAGLFRPPYGKISSSQSAALQKQGYTIIMWSILSKDYDENVSKEACLINVLKHIKPGSIIVFHDSLKAFKNLKYVLPKVLAHCKQQGWKCESLSL